MPQRKLAKFEPPPVDATVAEALDDFVARRTAAPRQWIEAAAGAVSLRVVGTADACPKSNEASDGVSRQPRRVRLSGAEPTGQRTRR